MGTLVNGIKEIFATAKTTGSNVMLCGNDGTPDGHMTMANLASVLGASKTRINLNEGIDNLKTPGIYYLNGTNGEQGLTDDSILIVTSAQDPNYANTLIVSQERIPKGNFSEKYIRHYHNNIGWTNWFVIRTDIPSFYKNYNDLSSLASALGVQIESFTSNSHYGYTFPTSDGFAIKLSIDAYSFVLFCLGDSGKLYYKYIWQGSDNMDWHLINVVQQ